MSDSASGKKIAYLNSRAASASESEADQPQMSEGWNPDQFPTSAKPIIRGWTLLILVIVGLCALVSYFSEPEVPTESSSGSESVSSGEQLGKRSGDAFEPEDGEATAYQSLDTGE